jgi:uroporphyrinogen-III decarboxylase
VLLEAACEVRHHLLGAAFVAVSVTGPFTLAAGVAGEASFLENLQDPGARERDILECAVQSSTRLVHAAREEGLGIMIAEPLAALISCSLFLEVLTPGLSRILAEGGEIVHICGDSSHLLPLLPSLGAPAFSLDRVDLAAASQAFGDGPMVVGGLTATAVRDGPPKRVYSATAHVCGTVERRFIPCTGCDLVWDTPAANVLAFVEGARVALGRRTMRDGRLSGLRAVSPGTV